MPDEITVEKLYDPPMNPAPGVTSRWPARGRLRERLLAAERERNMNAISSGISEDDSQMGIDRRQEAYGEFLRRQGLTPLDQVPAAQREPSPPPPAAALPPPPPAAALPPPPPAAAPPASPPLLNPSERTEEHSRSDLKPP
jgi:hypothetical protein